MPNKQKLHWHTEKRKVSTLIPWDKNPNTMDEKERGDLHHSIDKFNYVETVIINLDDRIIGGHHRIKELLQANRGDEELEVRVPNRKLTAKEHEELAIRLNKNRGHWDEEMQAKLFEADDLKSWGFDDEELNSIFDGLLEVVDDEFDFDNEVEKVKNPVTKPGDVYILGKHKLLCGNSLLPGNWARLMGKSIAQLHLTDPPYNVNYTGGTKEKLKIKNDKMKDADFIKFLSDYFTASTVHLKPGGSVYCFHSDSEGLNFRKAFIDAGNKLAQCLVWVKNSIVMGRQDYQWQHEPILYGWKKGGPHKWYSDRKQSTVLNFDRPLRNEEHPTMKPIELIGYLIQNSSCISGIVVDGFVGSGTTLIVSEQLKRICYCMEDDPVYCDVIVTRWEKLTGLKAKIISNGNSKKESSETSGKKSTAKERA